MGMKTANIDKIKRNNSTSRVYNYLSSEIAKTLNCIFENIHSNPIDRIPKSVFTSFLNKFHNSTEIGVGESSASGERRRNILKFARDKESAIALSSEKYEHVHNSTVQ